MKLATTDTDFRDLERAAAGRAQAVTVPRLALQHLIADHLDLVAAVSKHHGIEPGRDQQSLAGWRR